MVIAQQSLKPIQIDLRQTERVERDDGVFVKKTHHDFLAVLSGKSRHAKDDVAGLALDREPPSCGRRLSAMSMPASTFTRLVRRPPSIWANR